MKVLLVAVLAVMLIGSFSLANDGNPFAKAEQTASDSKISGFIDDLGGDAIGIAQTCGYIIAVVMVLVVGIQWVMATPAKKQELKGRMWNIVIGAALIVGASFFLGIIYNTVNDLKGGTNGGNGGNNGDEEVVEVLPG